MDINKLENINLSDTSLESQIKYLKVLSEMFTTPLTTAVRNSLIELRGIKNKGVVGLPVKINQFDYRCRVLGRKPDPGQCVIRNIDFDDQEVTLSNGYVVFAWPIDKTLIFK